MVKYFVPLLILISTDFCLTEGKPVADNTLIEIVGINKRVDDLNGYLDELQESTDASYRESLLDKLKFGAELRTRIEMFNVARDDDTSLIPQNSRPDATSSDVWSNRFRLNFMSNVTEDLVLRGRLSQFSIHNASNAEGNIISDEKVSGIKNRPDQGGELLVERAYAEYFIPDTNLSLTIGRLPVSDGPPLEFKNNTKRRGTYPIALVDGVLDGLIFSYNMEESTDIDKSMLRLGYGKAFTNIKKIFRPSDFTDIVPNTLDDNRAAYLGYESEVLGVDDSLFSLNYFHSWNQSTESSQINVPGAIIPDDLADSGIFGGHIQGMDIYNSGFDMFMSYSYQRTYNKYPLVLPAGVFPNTTVPTTLYVKGDNIFNNINKTVNGELFFTGLRYNIESESLNYPKLGFEYHHNTKSYTAALGGEDILNKLAVLNGTSYELYYIQPINEHLQTRLGYTHIIQGQRPINTDGALGASLDTESTINNIYFVFDVYLF
jgi:hypothetical protein